MAIRTEDVAGLYFSDVAGAKRIGPVTPGEVLREEFMLPLGLSGRALARELGVPPTASPRSWRAHVPFRPRPRSCLASGSVRRPSSGSICKWRTIWRRRAGTHAGLRERR